MSMKAKSDKLQLELDILKFKLLQETFINIEEPKQPDKNTVKHLEYKINLINNELLKLN